MIERLYGKRESHRAVILTELAKEAFEAGTSQVRRRANGLNIVGCYMFRPFTHSVACCCTKFETGQTFSPVQTNATLLASNSQNWWESLRPFARNFPKVIQELYHSLYHFLGILYSVSITAVTWSPRMAMTSVVKVAPYYRLYVSVFRTLL